MFFKLIQDFGGSDRIVDIIKADSHDHAVMACMDEWPSLVLHVAEATRSEWLRWRMTNWHEIDRMENDMVSVERF